MSNDTYVDSTTQTDAAKSLVAAVVRAFYDDTAVVVVDFLLDAKFLRDGNGMGSNITFSTSGTSKALHNTEASPCWISWVGFVANI